MGQDSFVKEIFSYSIATCLICLVIYSYVSASETKPFLGAEIKCKRSAEPAS